MPDIKFISCTQTQYNGLLGGGTLTAGALYYVNDSRRIYRATGTASAEMYGQPYEIVTAFPESGQKQGTLYVNSNTYEVKAWVNSAWATLSLPVSTTVNSSSTDTQIPTAKAVYDAIPKTGTTVGKVPVLDSNGKLSNSVMPEISISRCVDAHVATKNGLTSLSTAEVGDYAIVEGSVSDDGFYILNGEYNVLGNWIKLTSTGSSVTVDSTITSSSSNPVQSSAIYSELQGKANVSHTHTASDVTGLANVATTGSYSDLTTKLEWTTL